MALAAKIWCQAPAPLKVFPAQCPAGVDFEHDLATNAAYTVSSVQIKNPFDFLPWVRSQDEDLRNDLATLAVGKPFSRAITVDKAFEIIESFDLLPATAQVRLKILVEVVAVTCHASGDGVDVEYRVYTSQITPAASGTVEGQKEADHSPQTTAGLTQANTRPFRPSNLIPQVGYDSSDKLFAGGRLVLPYCGMISPAPNCNLPLQAVIDGHGSQAMESVHAALQFSTDSLGPILHSDYLINYDLASAPTGAGQIRRAAGSLEYSGTSAAFLTGNVNARFGGLVEKGDEQGLLRVPIPAGDTTASAVNVLKLYGGLDSRMPNNVLSASFGLELGTADVSSGIQWKKYIGDLHHDFWHAVGEHMFDLESRLTVGRLQDSGPVPVSERFFGGSYEQPFIPDDSWQIPANPLIRAIPGVRFFETSAGAGGDRFTAGNFTAAFSVWQKPLVPDVLRKNQEFTNVLNAQINTATTLEQLHFVTSDPSYHKMTAELEPTLNILGILSSQVEGAAHMHPDDFATQFKACKGAVRIATNRAKSAFAASDAKQYGLVLTLLTADPTEKRLNKVITACGDLSSRMGNTSPIDMAALRAEEEKLESDYRAIDQSAAHEKAEADMAFVSRTMRTLFKDVNLASISPVAVFDVAQIGPSGPGVNGIRYGPGGGLRLELASTVHFTVGYARNIRSGPGEGSGAIFFSMGLRDLFH